MSGRVFCSLAGNLLEWSRCIILHNSILDIFFLAYFNILVTILNRVFPRSLKYISCTIFVLLFFFNHWISLESENLCKTDKTVQFKSQMILKRDDVMIILTYDCHVVLIWKIIQNSCQTPLRNTWAEKYKAELQIASERTRTENY